MLVPIIPTSTQEDEHLQLAKTLWVEGDWIKLVELVDTAEHCVHTSELNMYIATAFAQQGDLEKARQYWEQAVDGEAGKNPNHLQGYRLLLSGVHNSLARAKVVTGELYQSQSHWDKSLGLVITGPQQRLAKQVRAKHQLKQLGLPESWAEKVFEKSNLPLNVPYETLSELHQQYPNDPAILIGVAESAQRQKLFEEAIRHWQTLASLLQENMPQTYYDRLEDAYLKLKRYPLGLSQDEILKGGMDKHEVLGWLHKNLNPKLYFEIGVESGKSLLLAKCKAIGVDPMPKPNVIIKENHKILKMTSDYFFGSGCKEFEGLNPDLSFIDGMHLFEYVLRDFINTEKKSKKNSVIVVDDIFPGSKAQAERERRTRAWTGDVWKLAYVLMDQRKDLEIYFIDAHPTGLMVIKNLNPNNELLEKKYKDLVVSYKSLDMGESEREIFVERKVPDLISSWRVLSERFVS
ncbi:MAG: class I SAM-dependent methyltransferase [Gammaproteobacteria bacterium]|nr:class I SAM-dependent methyltransferase [Gammaproteobacteria bacterium]